jgi:methyl-accepting chemotaxis protein
MGRSIGQGNHAALEGMITGLMSGVKDATSRELGMLVDAMREAAGELKVAKSGIGESGAEFGQVLARAAEGMNGSATRIADAMESRVGEIDARMQRMDDVLSSGAARFDSMGGAMSEQMADGLRKAMECIAAAATSGAETAREHAQAGLAPVLSELKGLIGEIRNSAEDSRSALVAGGRSAADDLGAALSKVGDDLTGASARASTVLVESFQESTARMVGAIDGAVAGYMTTTQTLAARLATVEQGFDLLDQSVRRNVGQMVEVGGAMTSAGQAFGTASDQLRQAAAPVLSTLQTVEGAATSARDALRLVQETGAAMREAATAMAATSQAAVKAFESYEQRFAGVDAGLGQTVAKLKDGVIELGSQVTAVVVEYDKHLASALGSLRTGVQEIAEAVDGLGDKLAEAA